MFDTTSSLSTQHLKKPQMVSVRASHQREMIYQCFCLRISFFHCNLWNPLKLTLGASCISLQTSSAAHPQLSICSSASVLPVNFVCISFVPSSCRPVPFKQLLHKYNFCCCVLRCILKALYSNILEYLLAIFWYVQTRS